MNMHDPYNSIEYFIHAFDSFFSSFQFYFLYYSSIITFHIFLVFFSSLSTTCNISLSIGESTFYKNQPLFFTRVSTAIMIGDGKYAHGIKNKIVNIV